MNTTSFGNKYDLSGAVAEVCIRLPVALGSSGLARELSGIAPDLAFRDVLTRGGWYRLGGVVDSLGHHLSDDLVRWAESELARCSGDIHALCVKYSGSGLRATRLVGRAHYLVAPTGSRAADFVQVEIEELQEVVSHELFANDVPGALEELFEPPDVLPGDSGPAAASPLGLPFYSLRRVIDVASFLQRMAGQKPEIQIMHRFTDDWQNSSAGQVTHFSNHWIIAVREYLDRYRQTILQASPLAALNGAAPKFVSAYGARGMALNEALQRFDRQAGYPMAWFFNMLTTKTVPPAVAQAVFEDVQGGGFGYLPERDVKVLKDWLHRPYCF